LVGRELNSSPKLLNTEYNQKRLKCIFNKGVLFYLEFNIRICFFLLLNKTDIVVANDLDTILGVYYGSNSKTTRVFDAHELFTEVPELQGEKLKKNIWKWVEKTFIPKFQKHYTVNDSLAKILEDRTGIMFSVVRNVPLKTKLKKNKTKVEKYILYQGALNKGRGLVEFINVMTNIDLKLKIAGRGDIENELKALVVEKKLESKIEFLGNLEPSELLKITQSAYIGLNLLENNSLNYYYSLANKYFDYIQQEVPQICMNFPEYKVLNKEFEVAVLIKNLDKANILNALKRIQEVEYYKQLQKNCKKAKETYIWENELEKLLSNY